VYHTVFQTPPQVLQSALDCLKAGQLDAAEGLLQELLAQQPDLPDALLLLATLRQTQGKHAEALALLAPLAEKFPRRVDILTRLGNAYASLAQWEPALGCFHKALRLSSSNADAYNGLGYVHQHQGQQEAAFEAFIHAVTQAPSRADMAQNLANSAFSLGQTLHQNRQWAQARRVYVRALPLLPNDARLLVACGNTLIEMGQYEQAAPMFARALQVTPNQSAARVGLGVIQYRQGQLEESIQTFRTALRHNPESVGGHYNQALSLLKLRRFAEGWPGFEWRRNIHGHYRRQDPRPEWQGEPAMGKTLLVVTEQGVGDAIHYLRFLKPLKDMGATVLLECKPELADWLATCPWVDDVLVRGAPQRSPRHHWFCYLLSLPLRLQRDGPEVFLPGEGVLPVSPARRQHWEAALGSLSSSKPGPRLGVCWTSQSDSPSAQTRSCPPAVFQQMLQEIPATWVSLLPGQTLPICTPLPSPTALQNFEDTAALISLLDGVITIDTAVAHLAGSLGKPTWLLLPFESDWRWFTPEDVHEEGWERTPWYSSLRLFRQPAPGHWEAVCHTLQQHLRRRSHAS
jgi:tetratricopeptide (TPR) repeat protein